MRMRNMAILAGVALALAACGGRSSNSASSSLNPLRWFGGSGQTEQASLTPDGGYPTQSNDQRALISGISGARWEPLYEGRMLIVTGKPATKGWWAAELVTEVPMPKGRIRGDENGTLRLRMVALPPLANTYPASAPSSAVDDIEVALTLSHEAMATIREVVITGAGNSVTLRP